MGENLGYKTSVRSVIPSDPNYLLFATTKIVSIIVRNMLEGVSADDLSRAVIVMDEAHHPQPLAIELLAYLK